MHYWTKEKLRDAQRHSLTRRHFLRNAAVLASSVPLAGLLAACGGDDNDVAGAVTQTPDALPSTPPAAAETSVADEATATAPSDAATTNTSDGPWTFTDDRGTTISLPQRPERIVAQVSAAAALWDYGVRPIAVFGPQRGADGSQDPQSGNVDLDAVESLGEAWGEFDLEMLAALQPDLLVSQLYEPDGVLWYVPEEGEAVVDEIVPSVGVLVADMPIITPINRFAELAQALGADLDAPEAVEDKERFDSAVDDLTAAIAEKPDLTVLVTAGAADQLYIANPVVADDLIFFRELGLDIIMPDVGPDEFWETLSWEQANKYPADLILNDARTQSLTPEQLLEIPTWTEHAAVQADQVADWHAEPIYSYKGYAPVLEELVGVIREADAGVV